MHAPAVARLGTSFGEDTRSPGPFTEKPSILMREFERLWAGGRPLLADGTKHITPLHRFWLQDVQLPTGGVLLLA